MAGRIIEVKNVSEPKPKFKVRQMKVLEESAFARAQAIIQEAIDQTDLSMAEVSREMGRNRSFVTRMLSSDHNLTIKTMTRALAVLSRTP